MAVFAVVLLATLYCGGAIAETPAKVDLETAKAELAKAELAKAKREAAEEAKSEEKAPRKRLFGRGSKKEKVKKEEATPEPKVEKKKSSESKSRKRLFKREKKSEKKTESKPVEKAKPKDDDDERRGVFKRISPFGKKDKPSAEEKPKVADVAPEKKASEEGGKKRLLGGLFAKGDVEKSEPKKEAKRDKKDGEGSSKMLGFFRNKSDSKEFAKVDKTKLGKTVDAKPAGGALTKKSSTTGALGWYVVTDPTAPFYAVGPGQPMPPEKILDRGSMLTVTKGGWGWCNVKLGSGELGVVASGAMRPATLAEVSRHTRPVATASRSRGSRKLFNILGRGTAELDLPTSRGDGPIRNFGLLPPIDSSE